MGILLFLDRSLGFGSSSFASYHGRLSLPKDTTSRWVVCVYMELWECLLRKEARFL